MFPRRITTLRLLRWEAQYRIQVIAQWKDDATAKVHEVISGEEPYRKQPDMYPGITMEPLPREKISLKAKPRPIGRGFFI